ncbi:hypothetical protein, partial [Enterococcus faecium]|uniref:hypothetical protein n=1 Tax=Enterococcus faecium TaxID=1352 RepID=UPI003F43FE10
LADPVTTAIALDLLLDGRGVVAGRGGFGHAGNSDQPPAALIQTMPKALGRASPPQVIPVLESRTITPPLSLTRSGARP